jgi:proliferating cell nuclear antigen PCNA
MKLHISDKTKKDVFISLFHLLKQNTSSITLMFYEDHLYIQGMDNSHVCLFDIKIMAGWFASYILDAEDQKMISMDTSIFHMILNVCGDEHSIILHYEGDPDHLEIDIKNETGKNDFNKQFSMPLCTIDSELMNIPETEYDAEFSIPSKKMQEITSQLSMFGDVMDVNCTEDALTIGSDGTNGKMTVNVPIDDLSEYAISEDITLSVSYSLNYIHKMCLSTKLASEVEFSILEDQPMRIRYDLGSESTALFYIAPKIKDD